MANERRRLKMFKHLVISGLTVLTLFAASLTFTGSVYSYTYAELPLDPYYKYMHVHDMYVEEPSVEAAKAVYISTQSVVISTGRDPSFVTYRRYVRPSDKMNTKAEEVAWIPTTVPVEMGKTTTFTAPNGFTTHVAKHPSQHPIRDFRATYWVTKYYRDEFHNQASYNKTYGPYNYWNAWDNSSAGNQSVEAPFGD
jgi:hypothetical protein